MKKLLILIFIAILSIPVYAQITCDRGTSIFDLNDGFLTFFTDRDKNNVIIEMKKYDKELHLVNELKTQYEFNRTAMSPSMEIPEDESYFLIIQNHTFKSTTVHMLWLDKDLKELSSVGGEFEELKEAKADRLAREKDYVVSYYPEMYGAFNGIRSHLIGDVLYEFRYTKMSMGEDGPVFLKFNLKEKSGLGKYDRNWLTKLDVEPKDIQVTKIYGPYNGKIFLYISTGDESRKVYEVDDESGEILNEIELNNKLDDDIAAMGFNAYKDGRLCFLGVKEEGFTVATVSEGEIGDIVKLGPIDYIALYTEANKKTTGMKKDQTRVSSCDIQFNDNGKCFITVPVYGVTKLSDNPYRILGFDMIEFDNKGSFVKRGFITTNNDGMIKSGGSTSLATMGTYDFEFVEMDGEIALCFRIPSASKKNKYDLYSYKGEFSELMPAKIIAKEKDNSYSLEPKSLEASYNYTIGDDKKKHFKIVPLR